MKNQKTSIFLSLLFLGFFLLSSCGGGTGPNGSTERAMGSVSTVSSSVPVALNKVFSAGSPTSTSLRLGHEGEGSAGVSFDDFDNCILVNNPDGSFSITCSCMANGTPQGTVTHTFINAGVRATCTRADGSTGTLLTFDGTGTTTFDACAVEKCDKTLILDGAVSETVHHTIDTCNQIFSSTVNLTTAEACGGLTIADGSSISTVGLNVDVLRNNGQRTVSGTLCIDTVSTNFSSLVELAGILDPAGICENHLENDDDDSFENDQD